MSTGGRLFRCSGLILSRPGAVHDSISYFGRENLWNDLSVFPQMVRRQVDMAVEEIRVEVSMQWLFPSGSGEQSSSSCDWRSLDRHSGYFSPPLRLQPALLLFSL
ncbi:hypothetical protein RB195_023558 [Necator americanus]|uniref:Uncharacterized protein n=1 Tax=Necator americanus TaxID=51031 RepID=A0ABR1EJW5_NECAM